MLSEDWEWNAERYQRELNFTKMDGPNNGIVLYHYSFSPYARKVLWYLALRGIDYAQCVCRSS